MTSLKLLNRVEYKYARKANALLAQGTDISTIESSQLIDIIEAVRPIVRMVHEEKIIGVGSHVTSCTLCDTSWLTDSQFEHHEETCLFHWIPEWMTHDKS